jgi:hypothetical protein
MQQHTQELITMQAYTKDFFTSDVTTRRTEPALSSEVTIHSVRFNASEITAAVPKRKVTKLALFC